MQVSVVMAAYNAAATLDQALASLKAQTFPAWEAVVVDDGSVDDTLAVANRWAEQDGRIRVLHQRNGGVSAARNAGIAAATYDWLVFLDADDWLEPEHLSRMAGAIASDPGLDVVHCGSARVAPDGRRRPPAFAPELDQPFEVLGRTCALDIHACLVRRSLVQAVGGFDTSLVAHEDWDLWQRVARAGARFGGVREVLATYRMRPKSASTNAERGLADAIRVVRRTHAPDPRVPAPGTRYTNGLPSHELPDMLFFLAAWSAGLVLGEGGDARPLLHLLDCGRAPALDPFEVASCLYDGALLPACRTEQDWEELWPVVARGLDHFLSALEVRCSALHLAQRARYQLEQLILNRLDVRDSLTIGATRVARIDADRTIGDVVVPEGVTHLRCIVEAAGTDIGVVDVPACGGSVAGTAIVDAIAADLAWPLFRARIRAGLWRDRRLVRRLVPLLLERGTLGLALGLMRGRRWRHTPQAQERLRDTARRLIREGVLVTAAPAGNAAPSPAAPAGPWTARQVTRGHSAVRNAIRHREVTEALPIIVYRRVAPDGPSSMERYRVSPDRLEEQLAYLSRNGYYGVTLDDWRAAMAARSPLVGRAVLITFDEGYRDFATHAWPLLRRYGFPATVFLVADAVGGSACWDAGHGESAPLLSWPEVRQLRGEGVRFASHGSTHRPLIGLPVEEVLREGARARAVLERELGEPVLALAYPYGDHDAIVRRLAAACGYECAVTCDPDRSRLTDDPMALPRLEISGADDLAVFAAKVGAA